MEKISIPDELIMQIQRYVREGRFRDVSDFLVQAIKLLLYAEEKKGQFVEVIKQDGEPAEV
jgi:Arc/MetJ-type ribon-helix-helix transcriptional regulator